MSRWVVPQRSGLRAAVPGGDAADDVLGRIAKYVPAEILAAYTSFFSVLVAMDLLDSERIGATFGLIGLFLVVTFFYIWKMADEGSVRKCHLIVSPCAFVAWAYPISSALLGDWYRPLLTFGLQATVVALSLILRPVE